MINLASNRKKVLGKSITEHELAFTMLPLRRTTLLSKE